MVNIVKPKIDPGTQDPSEQFRLLAHEYYTRAVRSGGTPHSRMKELQASLEALSGASYQEGIHIGERQVRVALVKALTTIEGLLFKARGQMPAVQPGIEAAVGPLNPTLEDVNPAAAALETALAQISSLADACREAEQVALAQAAEGVKEAVADPEPAAPEPPAGLHRYRLSVSPAGIKAEPTPAHPLKLENCVVFSQGRWVAHAGSNEALPCWVASRTKPKE